MCVSARVRIMGCGKSHHDSPEVSQTDSKDKGSFRKHASKNAGSKAKKAKRVSLEDMARMDNDANETSPSSRKVPNGKNRPQETTSDTRVSFSSSSSGSQAATSSRPVESDQSNGATKPQGGQYLLEVPNEVYKMDISLKTTSKDHKTLSAAKHVHATTSQLEFFKMLDEKIEMGDDYISSNEAFDNSSLDTGNQ